MTVSVDNISVVVPVYNNEASLQELVERLHAVLAGMDRNEIILVDDGSSDGSWAISRRLTAADDRVIALKLSRNFGQHRALTAGLEAATGDSVIFMDADLEDQPEEIPRLLEALSADDVDIVYTIWDLDGERAALTSRLFNRVFTKIARVHLPNNLGAFRAFTSQVGDALLQYPEQGLVYATAMPQLGYDHEFLTVHRDQPVGRRTSYTFRKRLALASQILISYSSLPHRLVTWLGAGLSGAAAVYLVVLLIQYALGTRLPSGLTLVLGITVLLSGVLLLTVGVLFAYTYRIFHEVLGRPRYHVARRVGRGLADPS